jgi:pimeloyl-ACP methyl ester carboxylesterase
MITLVALSESSPQDVATAFTPPRQSNNERTKATNLFSFANSPIREEIRYIAGRRALILHPPPSNQPHPSNPPLVILGGMAQSISSWEFHLQHLSAVRSVMVYEALGQGPPPPSEVCSIDGLEVTLDQYYDDVTLERQGRDFWSVVDEAFFDTNSYYSKYFDGESVELKQVDVAGFSFGGRVAMAAATIQPKRIRRLHLTGVGAERDEYANVILTSWKEILGVDDVQKGKRPIEMEECDPELHSSRCTSRLRAFAWSIILSTYSEKFLASAGPKRVQSWVEGVCQYNTEEGLRALLLQTHGSTMNQSNNTHSSSRTNSDLDFWTPAVMAQRIKTNECVEYCRILVGSLDKMASPVQAEKLAQIIGLTDTADQHFRVLDGHAHAVPMEALRSWRDDVVKFLK